MSRIQDKTKPLGLLNRDGVVTFAELLVYGKILVYRRNVPKDCQELVQSQMTKSLPVLIVGEQNKLLD